MPDFTIDRGFSQAERARVAELYWEAFSDKLGVVLGPRSKALAFVANMLDPGHAIVARNRDALLGVVGFKTSDGALVGGSLKDMRKVYGWFGSWWRASLLGALERDVENTRFLLDGVFVAPDCRGKGIGSALLDAVCAEAARRGFDAVRLDVVDSNIRARALYERHGFKEVAEHRTGVLSPVFGFRTSAVMVRKT